MGFAKNRLNKFYNPKLYKAPAPAFEQTGVAPPPPPETFGAYAKKGEESGGVINMLDTMVADLDKEITETEVEEKENQAEYETLISESAKKRAADSKSNEAMATHQFLSEVHGDCDWLLTNFEARKQARAGEVDALKKGKAVLSGADFSLLQSAAVHRHGL